MEQAAMISDPGLPKAAQDALAAFAASFARLPEDPSVATISRIERDFMTLEMEISRSRDLWSARMELITAGMDQAVADGAAFPFDAIKQVIRAGGELVDSAFGATLKSLEQNFERIPPAFASFRFPAQLQIRRFKAFRDIAKARYGGFLARVEEEEAKSRLCARPGILERGEHAYRSAYARVIGPVVFGKIEIDLSDGFPLYRLPVFIESDLYRDAKTLAKKEREVAALVESVEPDAVGLFAIEYGTKEIAAV